MHTFSKYMPASISEVTLKAIGNLYSAMLVLNLQFVTLNLFVNTTEIFTSTKNSQSSCCHLSAHKFRNERDTGRVLYLLLE